MIIKSISCKTYRFRQLMDYINKEQGRTYKRPILYNLSTKTHHIDRIEAEFVSNAQHIRKRKGAVIFFQEILSIHPKDSSKATPEMLENLVYEYLQRRAKDMLAYGRIERGNKGNLHCHLIIAGNVTGSSKKLTLSKKEFAQIQREIESIQKSHYPQLENSLHYTKTEPRQRETIYKTNAEYQRERRYKEQGQEVPPTRKEQARKIVQAALLYATSEQDFMRKLEQSGFSLYYRGQTAGVEDLKEKRKYRVSTLGLEPVLSIAREQWGRLEEGLSRFEALEQDRFNSQVKALGFRDDIKQTLSIGEQSHLPGDVQESLERIGEHQKKQRAKQREHIRDLEKDLGDNQGLGY